MKFPISSRDSLVENSLPSDRGTFPSDERHGSRTAAIAVGPVAPLRFAILCDGLRMPKWQARCVESLLGDGAAELKALFRIDEPPVVRTRARRLRHYRTMIRTNLLWRIHSKFFVEPRVDAMGTIDASHLVGQVPCLSFKTKKRGHKEWFFDEDIERIRALNLDFILRFSGGILLGDFLESARYGVWSFHHGDERHFRGRPPGFWELATGSSTVGVILQRISRRLDGGLVLHRGLFPVHPFVAAGTHAGNLDQILYGAAHFPSTVCREIQRHGFRFEPDRDPTLGQVYSLPSNRAMLRYGSRIVRNLIETIPTHHKLTKPRWTIGIGRLTPKEAVSGASPREVRWLDNPRGKEAFRADPFALRQGKTTTIVFEEFEFGQERGRISASVLDERDVEVAYHADILPEACHLSYPFVFEHDGVKYCIAESHEARRAMLYRSSDFPGCWEKHAVLFDDFAAVDSTLHHDGETWWLFCTDHAGGDNTHLHIWFADELCGPWTPHPLNPVKCDVTCSRPAGRLFEVDGRLYRPAQDCAGGYGRAIAINEIQLLSRDDFRERKVARLRCQDRRGMHTISFLGDDQVLIDGYDLDWSLKKAPPGK